MGLHYDILTMIIDIHCSINENSDSHFKIIFLVKVDFCLSKNTRMPEESTTLETQPSYTHFTGLS